MKREMYSILLNEKFRGNFISKAILKFKTQTALAKHLDSKLDRRVTRENIKEWLKGKHKYGWDILIPINILKELCIINSQNIEEIFNHAVKFNPPWKNPNKINLLVKQNKIRVIKRNNKKYLDLATILPQTTLKSIRSRKKLPLFAKIKKNEIELWSEACWKKSIIKLKRYIELNDLFFIGLSIYTSEGSMKGKYNQDISISNSEPAIINLFFIWINSFLKNFKYSANIEFNGKNCDKDKLIDFWKNNVFYIKNSNITVIKRPFSGSRLIRNRGVLKIRIANTVLRSFILSLINKSKKQVLSHKLYSIVYLRGLLACEGSVYTKKAIKQVSIGSTDIKERLFIKKLLKKLKLNYHEGKYDIIINGWDSFYRLFIYNIFNIPQINSISKQDRFIKGLKKHQVTKGLIKLKKFHNKTFIAKDWQKEFNLKKYISAHKFLNKFIKNRILLSKFNKNIKLYYINNKKLNFLKQIWKLNNL